MPTLFALPASLEDEQFRKWILDFAAKNPTHAVLLMRPDGEVLWCNQAARAVLGPTTDPLAGHSYTEFFVPADVDLGMPRHELDVALSRGHNLCQRWLRRLDGTRFWAFGTISALRDDQDRHVGFLKSFRDMTSDRMQVETLQNQVTELTREVARLREGLAVVGHELRNPLAALVMAASVVERICDMPTDLQATMSRNAKAATRLIDDLVEHARADAGKLQLSLERTDLRGVLLHALEAAVAASGKAPDIRHFVPSAPIEIDVDPDRMQQVFANLVGNAIRFTPDQKKIWVTMGVEGREVVVHVADQGIGIPHEMLDEIFDMFTQADRGRSAGLGLGLALVKKIVERHGGTVQAKSAGVGAGSEFLVRLPLVGPASLGIVQVGHGVSDGPGGDLAA